MGRKKISEQTIKRLFALSGNRCAFPDCTQPVIDGDGNVIAQICHIEAANPGGERYNPNQSDDERAAFENILLLCNPHHVVTNDVLKYSAAALQAMKAAHEARHRDSPAFATDEIARRILASSEEQVAVNLGSGVQNVVQNGSIIVHQGLGYSDVSAIVHDLFRQNFPKLVAAAKQKAQENLDDFAGQVEKEVATRAVTPEQVEKLADPGTQFVLQQATIAGARSHDAARKLLAGLVVERLKRDDGLANIAFGEAVSVVPKLTSIHLRALAFAFFVTKTSFPNTDDWPSFNAALQRWAFLLPVVFTEDDLHHLGSSGAATHDALQYDIRQIWSKTYPTLFGNVSDAEVRKASPLAADFMGAYVEPLTSVKITPIGIAIALVYLQQHGLPLAPEIWFKTAPAKSRG